MTPPAHVGLLDTNVVVDLAVISPSYLPTYPVISAITLAELSAGPAVAADERTRAERHVVLQFAESSFDPLPFDTALAHDVPLFTCNVDDFAGIDGLEVRAVPRPDR